MNYEIFPRFHFFPKQFFFSYSVFTAIPKLEGSFSFSSISHLISFPFTLNHSHMNSLSLFAIFWYSIQILYYINYWFLYALFVCSLYLQLGQLKTFTDLFIFFKLVYFTHWMKDGEISSLCGIRFWTTKSPLIFCVTSMLTLANF